MSDRLQPWLQATTLCAVLVLAGVPAQTPPEPVPATGRDAELILAMGVSAARMVETVKALCALGSRTGGADSGQKAAEWVAARLAECEVECRVASGSEVVVWDCGDHSCELSVDGSEPVRLLSAWPVRGSPPVARGMFPLVAVKGSGAAPVREAVVYRVAMPETAELDKLASQGVVAMIVGGHPRAGVDAAGVPLLSPWTAGTPPALPLPVFTIGSDDAVRVSGAIATDRKVSVSMTLSSSERLGRPVTVAGRLGSTGSHRRVVLAATLESELGGPGASDAAAVAVVLETARVLAADSKSRDVAALPYEVVVVLNGDRRPQLPLPWTPDPSKAGITGFEVRFRRIAAASRRRAIHVRHSERTPAVLRAVVEKSLVDHSTTNGFWRSWTLREGHLQGQRPAPGPQGMLPFLEVMTTPRTWMDPPGDSSAFPEETDQSTVILTTADVPERAVLPDPGAMERAARFALVLLERLREEKAW